MFDVFFGCGLFKGVSSSHFWLCLFLGRQTDVLVLV